MFSIADFAEYINKRNGWTIDASYYNNIQEWKRWWEGVNENFHDLRQRNADGSLSTRRMFHMSMAKTVCEDWATILMSDETIIKASDPATNEWLVGDQNRKGFLDSIRFYDNSNKLVEQMMRSGTCAWVLSAENVLVKHGKIIPSGEARLWIDYLPAEYILPLTVRHGDVVEAAFVSEIMDGGHSYVYLQTHLLKKDGYHIQNEYFVGTGDNEAESAFKPHDLPEGMVREFSTGSRVPLFSVSTPNVVKSINGGDGLGMAIFSDAKDQIKAVDIAFNNFVKDLQLGGKKVFYDKSLLQYAQTSDNRMVPLTPDDLQNQLFMQMGDGDDLNESRNPIHEYNPSLRVEENAKAVQNALNYLSFKCGLGAKHYRFDPDKLNTATEYTGDRQDMRKHAEKHQIPLRAAVVQVMHGVLWAAKYIQGANVDPDAEITVEFGDSYFSDDITERMQMAQDVRDGYVPAYHYTMRWYDLDEDSAKKWISDAANDTGTGLFDEE